MRCKYESLTNVRHWITDKHTGVVVTFIYSVCTYCIPKRFVQAIHPFTQEYFRHVSTSLKTPVMWRMRNCDMQAQQGPSYVRWRQATTTSTTGLTDRHPGWCNLPAWKIHESVQWPDDKALSLSLCSLHTYVVRLHWEGSLVMVVSRVLWSPMVTESKQRRLFSDRSQEECVLQHSSSSVRKGFSTQHMLTLHHSTLADRHYSHATPFLEIKLMLHLPFSSVLILPPS